MALTVAQVIQKSSNVGTAKSPSISLPRNVGMFDNARRIRPAARARVSPGEVGGRLRPWKSWRPIEQATMSLAWDFRQPDSDRRAYTVFARDGDLIPLSLVKPGRRAGPQGRKSFSPQTAGKSAPCSEMAVQPEGTGAQGAGRRISGRGKTGTAYKLENGVYARKYVASSLWDWRPSAIPGWWWR